jgi:hypothetical protein
MIEINANSILTLGLKWAGFDRKVREKEELRRFRSFYGIGPLAIEKMLHDMQTVNDQETGIPICKKPNILYHLMALNWLKTYDTETILAGRWKLDEDTARKWVWYYIKKIYALKGFKIVWGKWGDKDDAVFVVSVDGVHCRTFEVRKDPSSQWYSHKHNGPGLTYELAIAIRSNNLVWINGPYKASTHDINMFRGGTKGQTANQDCLLYRIPAGKKAIGDKGYRGEPTKVSITRELDRKDVKHWKGRVKARHETFNKRIKDFSILSQEFRSDISKHKLVFNSVCILAQYDIENGHPLFEV